MNASQNQFLFLCTSVFIGIIGGIIYEPFYTATKLVKNKYAVACIDVAYFVVFGVISAYLHYKFNYGNLRLYSIIAEFVGLLLYYKSLHNIIAILEKICYNKVKSFVKENYNRVRRRKKG